MEELYPDIEKADGLSNLLNDSFGRIGSPYTTHLDDYMERVPRFFAMVKYGGKLSQVDAVAEKRMFGCDYWRDGVHLAGGAATDITTLAETIDFWMGNDVPAAVLAEKYPFITPDKKALAFDAGTEVEYTWNEILQDEHRAELHDFVALAIQDQILSKLFPYTSLYTLCFSRCTGFPYDNEDLPTVTPKKFGHFFIEGYQSSADSAYVVAKGRSIYLGEGTAAEALKIVKAALPADIKPAIKGTADGKP